MQGIIPIHYKIYTLRGRQIMLDSDLAELYQVTTKRLNEQTKRNIERFPDDFMFQLSEEEYEDLRSQIVTSSLGIEKDRDSLRSQFATLDNRHGNTENICHMPSLKIEYICSQPYSEAK